MKFICCILILFCVILCGCMQSEEPSATPTVLVTKRVIIDNTPTPSPTADLIPILTPKSTDTAQAEFDIFAIERNSNNTVLVINLDGNSVDIVKSINIYSICLNNTSLNFIPLNHNEISTLEDKHLASIYYAVKVDTIANGLFTININVTLNNGTVTNAVLYKNIEL